MRSSESSDDQAFNLSNASRIEPNTGQSSSAKSHAMTSSQQAEDWRSQLLPVTTVRDQEDVTVLQEQLEAAHQLLQYQQGLVDSLTEQLVSSQTHATQVEQDLQASQATCARQVAKIEDVESVCHDLKAQLRRQQTRIGEYRQVMQELGDVSMPLGAAGLTGGRSRLIPFAYDSVSMGSVEAATTVKASPVKPWSATEEEIDLRGPVALYQKLAAMTVAAASHHSRVSRRYGQPVRQTLKSANTMTSQNYNPPEQESFRVELPSFVHS